MSKQCMRCLISGRVQGVWFRASTKEQADALEIVGWARNLNDGRVEVMACGEESQLEILHGWLKQGPTLANVTQCIRENLIWEEYFDFKTL